MARKVQVAFDPKARSFTLSFERGGNCIEVSMLRPRGRPLEAVAAVIDG